MPGTHPFAAGAKAKQAHLRIMETTDLHGHLLPYDYHADRPLPTAGLSRTASLIAAARAEAPNTLLFDNGDVLQGSALADHLAASGAAARHPIIAAMNLLGYDAATVGNHDFNHGLPYLRRVLSEAAFPVVCANLLAADGAQAGQPLFPPYVLLDRVLTDGAGHRAPIRIGVIGLLPPQTLIWDHAHLAGRAITRDITETAAACLPGLRAAGADLVIALAHTGIGAPDHQPGQEDAALPLARLRGIDVLLLGHRHRVFPGPDFPPGEGVDPQRGTLYGKPAVMAGFAGSHLGLIDLVLDRRDGRWQIAAAQPEARPIFRRGAEHCIRPTVADAPGVLALAAPAHAAALADIRRPVGRCAVTLHSYFAPLAPAPGVSLVAEVQRAHVARLLARGPLAGLPVLAATAPFRCGGRSGSEAFTDIPAGSVLRRHLADLSPFPNTIQALRLTGAELADWLERAAGLFARITPGQPDQPLILRDFPIYNFDMISDASFAIDLSQPARFGPAGELAEPGAHRIRDLRVLGRPLDPLAEVIIATNSYRAAGGGQFAGTGPDRIVADAGLGIEAALIAHFAATDCVTTPAQPGWRFCPMPGTSVLFDTGPGARDHLHDVAGLNLSPLALGLTAEGFLRYRLTL
ncbi:bifunctional 2',3'-cyclic-nucleotide 2'-phosphodiesterase/3'-nucleotidase [Phaeovulum veldkampii]|nr:bifunctional 2',3'-cyclic-nucleotide 2'-phosphodiesterase/3'-nucleotidase [Phaeovulum veldkampii]TDQ63539.1 2',3'-cyclic-nucleotide 2'-phosphodiesterase/3'-nucleotidase [Phaeovulum veldkampii DSM 11550]